MGDLFPSLGKSETLRDPGRFPKPAKLLVMRFKQRSIRTIVLLRPGSDELLVREW